MNKLIKILKSLFETTEPTYEQKMNAIEAGFGKEMRRKVEYMNALGAEVRARCGNKYTGVK